MAVPSYTTGMGYTYQYGVTVGEGVNREDLLNVMRNIDPFDTPLFTIAPKTRAYHVTHQWPEDTLPTAVTAGNNEGADFSANNLTVPQRYENVQQIFRWDVQLTNTQMAVNPAGIRDMYRYEIEKGLKAVKVAVEKKTFGASGASATGAGTGTSATARLMKTIADFVNGTANNAYFSNATAIGGDGTTGTPVVETTFNGMLEKIYTQGGNPRDIFAAPNQKRQISAFAGPTGTSKVIDVENRALVNSVDVYISDFGAMNIHLDRWVPSQTSASATTDDGTSGLFFLDRTRIAFAIMRPPRHVPIASVGDSVRGMVLTELTLEVANTKGHGRMYGIKNN